MLDVSTVSNCRMFFMLRLLGDSTLSSISELAYRPKVNGPIGVVIIGAMLEARNSRVQYGPNETRRREDTKFPYSRTESGPTYMQLVLLSVAKNAMRLIIDLY